MHGCLFIERYAHSKQSPLTDSPKQLDPKGVPHEDHEKPEYLIQEYEHEIKNRTLNDNLKVKP